jgi:hypothetical protein
MASWLLRERGIEAFWDACSSFLIPLCALIVGLWTVFTNDTGFLRIIYSTLAALWLVASFLRWRNHFRNLRSRNKERWLVHRLLANLVHECFDGILCRATWFRHDRLRNLLYPFARYEHGSTTPVPRSRAAYPKGVSYTGLGWKIPGRIIIYKCPAFNSREEMEHHNTDVLKIPKRIVKYISNRMLDTKYILTVGLCTQAQHRDFLGVLSIDFYQDAGWPSGGDMTQSEDFKDLKRRLTELISLESALLSRTR